MFEDLFKNTIKDVQRDQSKTALSRANFVIQKQLSNETKIIVSSLNPELLIKAFKQFEKEAKNL